MDDHFLLMESDDDLGDGAHWNRDRSPTPVHGDDGGGGSSSKRRKRLLNKAGAGGGGGGMPGDRLEDCGEEASVGLADEDVGMEAEAARKRKRSSALRDLAMGGCKEKHEKKKKKKKRKEDGGSEKMGCGGFGSEEQDEGEMEIQELCDTIAGGGSEETKTSETTHVLASRLVVAHTPNIPRRYESLLKHISSLLTYESKGKSFVCTSNRKNMFLRWSRSDMCLFFEWDEEEVRMICWMHDIRKGLCIKFIVNPAFAYRMNEMKVNRSAFAFSSNFVGDNEWASVKGMLLTMFGYSEEEEPKDNDHLYVFTRVGNSVCFRNFQINSVPNVDDSSSPLFLTEASPHFCLKLVDVQGRLKSSNLDSNYQTDKNLKFCPILYYSMSSDQLGSCIPHVAELNGKNYSILLQNGSYVSSVEEYEGFNISLRHIIEKEPSLKIKPIIGSATNKESVFVRNRVKAVLRSLALEFLELFRSRKCVVPEAEICMSNVLTNGSSVKLHGLKFASYTEDLAKNNIRKLVLMIRKCFSRELIPIDMEGLLCSLDLYPLDTIETMKDDCSLMTAKERRDLLIYLHSEYRTNVDTKKNKNGSTTSEPPVGEIDASSLRSTTSEPPVDEIDASSFLSDCPYMDDWKQIIEDNEYMKEVSNWVDDVESKENDEEVVGSQDKDVAENKVVGSQKGNAVKQRMEKKQRVSQRSKTIKKKKEKLALNVNLGKLQFDFMRNFGVHMPEKANKDGVVPFRLALADYILTAYFPEYLQFIQKRMSWFLKLLKSKRGQRGDGKHAQG